MFTFEPEQPDYEIPTVIVLTFFNVGGAIICDFVAFTIEAIFSHPQIHCAVYIATKSIAFVYQST